MPHGVVSSRGVEKSLAKIPRQDDKRIRKAIRALADEPRPDGCKKLRRDMGFAVRVGEYRVLYRVDDDERVVRVYRVGDRKDVYR